MIDQHTDFFKIIDNFEKIKDIQSLVIQNSMLDYCPRATIVIPTYKRPNTLKDAIDSALNQIDYQNYEILIVDNEVERNTPTENLLKEFKQPQISYYKNTENLQMAGNWNRCFELAKGEFVVMLHDDDFLLPSFMADCMKIVDGKKDIGILKPLAHNWLPNEKWDDFLTEKYPNENKLQRLYDFSNFSSYLLGAPSGCLFNREKVLSLGGFNQDLYPMMDFCFTVVFSQHYQVYLYFKRLSLYRILINDTLNLSTLLTSFEGVYYLRRQLLKKYKIPRIIIEYFLSCNLASSISGYKKANAEFSYDIRKLGLRIPGKIEKLAYLYITRLLNEILNIFTVKRY